MFSLVVAAVLFGCHVCPAQTSDPLLLEYSDYYYDLYYGDYDNYDDSAVHSTAPRSIRVEKPQITTPEVKAKHFKNQKNNKKNERGKQSESNNGQRSQQRNQKSDAGQNNRRNQHTSTQQEVQANAQNLQNSKFHSQAVQAPDHQSGKDSRQKSNLNNPSFVTKREPLNVRLQRLLSHDKSSAQTILDILEAPRSSQNEILKFLRGISERIQQENEALRSASLQQTPQESPKTSQTFRTAPRTKPPTTRRPPPTRPPTRASTRPPTRAPTRPPTRAPTRPPTRAPTRPPPPPPTRPPPPPPTRPPPPPTTRPPQTRPPPTRPPPITRAPEVREPKSQNAVPAAQTVTRQFNQFPNFQSHQTKNSDIESPRQSAQKGRPVQDNSQNNNDRNTQNKSQQNNFRNSQHNSQNNNNNGRGNSGFSNNSKQGGNGNRNRNGNNKGKKGNKNFKSQSSNNEVEETAHTEPHSPTSSSGLTIEEFLTRYPEVKRLSSRFNDDDNIERPTTLKPRKHKNKNKKKEKDEKPRSSFTAFVNTPTPQPFTKAPRITPRQRQTKPPVELIQTTPQPRPNKQNNRHKPVLTTPIPKLVNTPDYEDSFDYDYYYDQLVPEHERFFQLPKTDSATPAPIEENKAGFQVFTHFSNENSNVNQVITTSRPKPRQNKHQKKEKKLPDRKPKAQTNSGFGGSKANSISPNSGKHGAGGPNQAGPYGYTDKGTFFEDSHFVGFPEKIEMVYQGFVWAMTMFYPDQDSLLHGGVHTILEDKVKREKLNLAGDYITRVSGRASPYNINRLTFYTKNGKKFGPWGDRHSEDSVDFDVTAPAGQALAFFSGTIDFGVPLRSVSFHWRPIQA